MAPIDPGDYYEQRDVEHSVLGDVHLDIPFFVATPDPEVEEEDPRGARKRPAVAIEPPLQAPGLLCSYTCGFTAQPPGTEGYAHPFRIMAPIVRFSFLREFGVKANELRKLKEYGSLQGLLYLPEDEALDLGQPAGDDEFSDDAAALLYRPALVTQSFLDARDRVLRLTEQGQRILIAAMIQVVSPNRFDPFDEGLRDPDLTDSWNP